jgi:hypothetical protein
LLFLSPAPIPLPSLPPPPPVSHTHLPLLSTVFVSTAAALPGANAITLGPRGSLVGALCYKPEGSGFDFRLRHWIFQFT